MYIVRILLLLISTFIIENLSAQAEENLTSRIPSQNVNYPCLYPLSEFYVIQNKKEMKDLAIDWENESCKKVNYPKIDFKQSALVGVRKFIKSCDLPQIKYEFLKFEDVITLNIEFAKNGDCRGEFESIYWFLIPADQINKKDKFELNERYTKNNGEN